MTPEDLAHEDKVRGWPLAWVILFLTGISLPLADQVLHFDPTPTASENRNLTEITSACATRC